MGLFDFLKKKELQKDISAQRVSVPTSEKKYYQPDEYYTKEVAKGTIFERAVVTFEERKRTAIPSKRGLYPAEILLLEYCKKGDYPGPKNGYPGFWWFSYGIRDVGAMLHDLENRGFITLGAAKDSVKSLTTSQLKELLSAEGVSVTGKKAELVNRFVECVSEEKLIAYGLQRKYVLTSNGQSELEENAYVPYMHRVHNKTTEDKRFGITFNVWSINKILGSDNKTNWKAIVDEQEQKMNKETADRNNSFMKDLKMIDPKGYKVLKTQDQQIAAVQKADAKYREDKDLDSYIEFWEYLWANGGLKFEGSGWHFKLPDLYIKAKRYDDALKFVINLKMTKPTYADKANIYIEKIQGLKSKQK